MSPDYTVTGNLFGEDLSEALSTGDYYDRNVADTRKLMPDMKILEKGENFHMFSATMLGYEITELQFFYLFGEKAYIDFRSDERRVFQLQRVAVRNIAKP